MFAIASVSQCASRKFCGFVAGKRKAGQNGVPAATRKGGARKSRIEAEVQRRFKAEMQRVHNEQQEQLRLEKEEIEIDKALKSKLAKVSQGKRRGADSASEDSSAEEIRTDGVRSHEKQWGKKNTEAQQSGKQLRQKGRKPTRNGAPALTLQELFKDVRDDGKV